MWSIFMMHSFFYRGYNGTKHDNNQFSLDPGRLPMKYFAF